jgi:hypothetical protein
LLDWFHITMRLNVLHALRRIDDFDDDLDMLGQNPANKKKLQKAAKEFRSYIEAKGISGTSLPVMATSSKHSLLPR